MSSFEELGVAPELVDVLAAEGVEEATPLQEAAVPLVRRENNVVLAAGPGAGTLVAWAAPALGNVPTDADGPRILVLTPTAEWAGAVAVSLARLSAATGHSVAALGSPWVLPERAHVLVGTPADVRDAAGGGRVSLAGIQVLVVDGASRIETLTGLDAVEAVIDHLPAESQRVLVSLPLTPGVRDLADRQARRAMTIPGSPPDSDAPRRGELQFRVVPATRKDEAVLATVAELLEGGDARHVLVFSRTEDRAADLGDFLTLHGYLAGAPGDADAPVWLGVEALAARREAGDGEDVAVVSADVPAGEDQLDRRHGLRGGGVVVVDPREIAHLRDTARRAGYAVRPLPLAEPRRPGGLDQLLEGLGRAVETEDVEAYLPLLEPLFAEHDATRIAAAAVALLRRKTPPPAETPVTAAAQAVSQAPTWVRLFFGVGEQDGVSAGDLVGAITGEARVPGEAVGRIDIRERHSLVDVDSAHAQDVIRAVNGTTIRGRATRVDVDRPRRGGDRGGARRRVPRS